MTGRPVAALTESVARQIVREHNGNRALIAVALVEEVIARGGWKANTCKPLLRAFELAAPSPASPAETREGEPVPHRIDIERAVELALVTITDDVTTEELAQQRDDLLAVIYCWRDEQAADARRAASPAVSLPGEDDAIRSAALRLLATMDEHPPAVMDPALTVDAQALARLVGFPTPAPPGEAEKP
jgi:hypothetical protein